MPEETKTIAKRKGFEKVTKASSSEKVEFRSAVGCEANTGEMNLQNVFTPAMETMKDYKIVIKAGIRRKRGLEKYDSLLSFLTSASSVGKSKYYLNVYI